MTFLIGGFRLTNFGDFRLTVFGQFNPTLTVPHKSPFYRIPIYDFLAYIVLR